MIKLKYKSLLVYSEDENKYFYETFGENVNIVYGKNTSGKSTLFQLLNYTFGINDEKDKLKDVLDLGIVSRLDCKITVNQNLIDFIIIRKDDRVLIKYGEKNFQSFDGIGGDSSYEHRRLKEYIRELFDFTLYLEQKKEYKSASIETIFLPYYIPQDVGWISIRKSFKGLDFYKNFKEDFLDYYLGITNNLDRKEKIKLEKELKDIQLNREFYETIKVTNDDLQISQLIDEKFEEKSQEYIQEHKSKKQELLSNEKSYVLKCNELAYLKERKNVLSKVKKNISQQNPANNDSCPTCNRVLEYNSEKAYEYYQNLNDTAKEIEEINNKIKIIQKDIDKLDKDIGNAHRQLKREYEVLAQYTKEEITYDKWIEHKVDVQIVKKIDITVDELNEKEKNKINKLEAYKTDGEIKKERLQKESAFLKLFKAYVKELGVKDFFDNDRYKKLYRMSVFPKQGVELHKTILAYNFAFNKIIQNTGVHRLPFVLDAIFKEDIEQDNKNEIVSFIAKYKPNDTQIFIAIAESENEDKISSYNKDYFENHAYLICIGNKKTERAFLSKDISHSPTIIDETMTIIEEN